MVCENVCSAIVVKDSVKFRLDNDGQNKVEMPHLSERPKCKVTIDTRRFFALQWVSMAANIKTQTSDFFGDLCINKIVNCGAQNSQHAAAVFAYSSSWPRTLMIAQCPQFLSRACESLIWLHPERMDIPEFGTLHIRVLFKIMLSVNWVDAKRSVLLNATTRHELLIWK